MEETKRRFVGLIVVVVVAASVARADNFTGDSRAVGKAEQSRAALSAFWFGKKFRDWSVPCPIVVNKASSASGRTSFSFDRGHVFGWRMSVGGSTMSDILDSAVPHEVNHTVLASELRRPLPRWLDEGAALYVESESEHEKQRKTLSEYINGGRFVKFSTLFANARDYPRDSGRLSAVYSEGFAIVSFLIENHNGGRETFEKFLRDVQVDEEGNSTLKALQDHYGYDSADDLERAWYARFRAASSCSCEHHSCKAPHSATFDPHLGVIAGDGSGGSAGLFVRSPLVAVASGGSAPHPCRIHFFTSRTCAPCQKFKREELPKIGLPASQFLTFEDDVREMRRANITTVPTFVVIHQGRETGRLTGFRTAAEVRGLLGSCKRKTLAVNTPEAAPPILGDQVTIGTDELKRLRELVSGLSSRLDSIEARPEPPVVDLDRMSRELDDLRRLSREPIGVRIETTDGKLIREKSYPRGTPLIFRFDEDVLTGKSSR